MEKGLTDQIRLPYLHRLIAPMTAPTNISSGIRDTKDFSEPSRYDGTSCSPAFSAVNDAGARKYVYVAVLVDSSPYVDMNRMLLI